MNIEMLKKWICDSMDNLPETAGAIFGLPASGYLDLNERPVLRLAADGVVREIECDLAEEVEIVRKTQPVDYARRPDGKSTIFIWYRNPGNYEELFRQHRFESGNATFSDLSEEYYRDTGFLKPLPRKKKAVDAEDRRATTGLTTTMTLHQHFQQIKRLFFPRWDRQNLWRISTRSRRNVHGYCDTERRVIEIVIQHSDQDERDRLTIHEICHAVASGGHGKVWQARLEKAAKRADELGRTRLAELLREEIVDYQQAGEGVEQAYQTIQDWVSHKPDLTLAQVKRSLADHYGLLVSEVSTKFRRIEKVYAAAKREALEARAMKDAWLKSKG